MVELKQKKQYARPIQIAEGIFWVGFHELGYDLNCNPYLVTTPSGEAAVIDGGSRPDFAVVMTKILQTGQDPDLINFLIYQHYDPDLCGSLPHFVDMCDADKLSVVSHSANNIFLRYYSGPQHFRRFIPTHRDGGTLSVSGRRLRFIETPYCHTAGSFVTYDEQTKTLFTSDLFGSFAKEWDLYLDLGDDCFTCSSYQNCPQGRTFCPLSGIIAFHRKIMTGGKALAHAMGIIKTLDIELLAPQHGSIVRERSQIYALVEFLEKLDRVGIDNIC